MPIASSTERILASLCNILDAIKHPTQGSPFPIIIDSQVEALKVLESIFSDPKPTKPALPKPPSLPPSVPPATPPTMSETAPPLRVVAPPTPLKPAPPLRVEAPPTDLEPAPPLRVEAPPAALEPAPPLRVATPPPPVPPAETVMGTTPAPATAPPTPIPAVNDKLTFTDCTGPRGRKQQRQAQRAKQRNPPMPIVCNPANQVAIMPAPRRRR